MLILTVSYYNEDAGYFMDKFIAISEDIAKLQSKAVEVADDAANYGHGKAIYDQTWETKVDRNGQQYLQLDVGDKYDDTYIINKTTPL